MKCKMLKIYTGCSVLSWRYLKYKNYVMLRSPFYNLNVFKKCNNNLLIKKTGKN